jgi:hypothetical protein
MAIDGRSSLGVASPPFLALFKPSQNPCFSLFRTRTHPAPLHSRARTAASSSSAVAPLTASEETLGSLSTYKAHGALPVSGRRWTEACPGALSLFPEHRLKPPASICPAVPPRRHLLHAEYDTEVKSPIPLFIPCIPCRPRRFALAGVTVRHRPWRPSYVTQATSL